MTKENSIEKTEAKLLEQMAWNEADALADGWQSEIFHKMEPGESVRGLYVGPGPDQELAEPDPRTGQVVTMPTWRVQALDKNGKEVGAILKIPGKHELNGFFRGLTPGNTLVAIKCEGKIQIGIKQVTRFRTFSKLDPERAATGQSVALLDASVRREAEAAGRESFRRQGATQENKSA